jgi:phage tail sheath protein FI
MPEYLAPGVFVEETSFTARPIRGGSTANTCFLGQIGGQTAPLSEPVLVTSFTEFARHFSQDVDLDPEPFAAAVRGFFENGGRRAYVMRICSDATKITSDDLALTAENANINLIAAPGFTDAASHEAIISHCERRDDRFAVLDMPSDIAKIGDITRLASVGGSRPRDADRGMAAVYGPWIDVRNPSDSTVLRIAPSGHICGIFARNDIERGVHRVPANKTLRGVISLAQEFTRSDLPKLNVAHINAMRTLSGRGIRLWGARTLTTPSSIYKYVSVRRYLIFLEQAIGRGTRWAVFEPNNDPLWASLRQDITVFLLTQWRNGALAGAKQDDAFFVRCGRDTMSQADLDNGRIVAQVGVALIRPAEFITFSITQTTSSFVVREG